MQRKTWVIDPRGDQQGLGAVSLLQFRPGLPSCRHSPFSLHSQWGTIPGGSSPLAGRHLCQHLVLGMHGLHRAVPCMPRAHVTASGSLCQAPLHPP